MRKFWNNLVQAMKIAVIMVLLFTAMALLFSSCGESPCEYYMLGGLALGAWAAMLIKRWCKE